MEKPKFLYKYHSAQRVAQIVRDLTFYFAPVAQLNDLYEFRVKSLYTETPESRLRVYAKGLVYQGVCDTIEEGLKFIDEDLIADVQESYEYTMSMVKEQLVNIMHNSGVTCFSEHRNNQRMWGTYGDNHSGAVIEFDTSSEKSKFASHLMPVFYLKEKPKICPSELISKEMTVDQLVFGFSCCCKTYDWRDEGEWRLLLLANEEQSDEQRIVPFERAAISRIFLGPRIKKEDEDEIWLAAGLHQPSIPIFKRKIDEIDSQEEHVGFEMLHSYAQLEYWFLKQK
jgi:Protein of unknown function (DUF2971)